MDTHLKLDIEVEERRKWKHQVSAVEASPELRSDRDRHLVFLAFKYTRRARDGTRNEYKRGPTAYRINWRGAYG